MSIIMQSLNWLVSSIDLYATILTMSIIMVILIGRTFVKFLSFNEIVVDLSGTKWNHKHFDIKAMYKLEELPPFYPNGWISVLESRDLKPYQIKPIFALGNDLVVFRGASGRVYIADAYCPHLGANLGVGGQVMGDSIKCPFHGWTFNNEGHCTEVPGINCSNLPKAKIKLWDCVEVNGFIFVWHHSNGETPNWFPIKINEIQNSMLVYRGRVEQIANCHIQEIPENGADVMHLNVLHPSPEFLGTVITKSKFYDLIIKFLKYDWRANWRPCPPPEQHIAHFDFNAEYTLFDYPLLPLKLSAKQIGPAIVHLYGTFLFLNKYKINLLIIQTIRPIAQMKHKIVQHFYSEPGSFLGFLFSKFALYAEARMIERDIVIWNNKKFLKQPCFAKNEGSLVKFRRWFNQFYTEKHPTSF